jgi:hypothetical protein
MRGSHLALSEATVKLINTREDLNALGIDELANLGANFRAHSVLLLAAGQKPTGGYWIHVTGVQLHGDELYFQGLANRPGPADVVTQALTYPYTAVLIEKARARHLHPELESVAGAAIP